MQHIKLFETISIPKKYRPIPTGHGRLCGSHWEGCQVRKAIGDLVLWHPERNTWYCSKECLETAINIQSRRR